MSLPSPGLRARSVACAAHAFVALVAADAQAQSASTLPAETIVVTGTRTPQPLSSVLADMSVIDRETIERSGVTGVADLLARQPGIEFSRNGGPGAVTGVFVRGSEARHTAVYIDGVRVDSQSIGGAVWEQLPLDQIERIEVLRGPAAAVYGSDAVAGVVQLFTKRGQGPARPTASATLGSYNTRQAQAGVSGSSDALDYSVSASHGRSDGFNARTTASANPDDDGWRRNTGQAHVGFQINPDHRVHASLLASRLRTQFDGFTPGADDLNLHTLRSANAGWQGRWSDDATTRFQVGQTESTLESQPDFFRTETTLRDTTLQHEQRIGPNVLSALLERRDDELLNPATAFTTPLEGRRHQTAAGLGWRADIGALGVQAHARHDDDSEFGSNKTGSLALGWAFLPQWRATVSTATSFRAPTLFQRFSSFGNPTLVPESGRNAEVGLRWSSGGHQLSATAWRNKVRNLIDFGPPGPCLDSDGCFVNVGRARLEGLTVAGRTQIANVALRGSVDWRDPRNAATDTLLARRAKQLAFFAAETSLGDWNFGTEVQAAGSRFDNAANTQRLGGYALVNLFVGKTLVPGLALQARIDNIADKSYELARTFATPGRNAQVTLRWSMP